MPNSSIQQQHIVNPSAHFTGSSGTGNIIIDLCFIFRHFLVEFNQTYSLLILGNTCLSRCPATPGLIFKIIPIIYSLKLLNVHVE